MIDRPKPIDVTIVPEDQRLSVPEKLFSHHFLAIENAVYYFANKLSADYHGAYWDFFTFELPNGTGFFMAPSGVRIYDVSCDNFFSGKLSERAFGITCCFYAFSNLSFEDDKELSALCAEKYNKLRSLVLDHPEGSAVLKAID